METLDALIAKTEALAHLPEYTELTKEDYINIHRILTTVEYLKNKYCNDTVAVPLVAGSYQTGYLAAIRDIEQDLSALPTGCIRLSEGDTIMRVFGGKAATAPAGASSARDNDNNKETHND